MILLIDFETTGLDTKTCRPLELGAALVSNDFKDVYQSFNCLIHDSSYPVITEEITNLTNIKHSMLEFACLPEDTWDGLRAMAQHVDGVVAHNAAFDRAVVFTANKDEESLEWLLDKTWLCSIQDVEKFDALKSKRLMHIALEVGVTVDPTGLHRASADVELMRRMLVSAGETWENMYEYHMEPNVYLQAQCDGPWIDGGKSTNMAKELGYSWEIPRGAPEGVKFAKAWVKKVKQKNIVHEINKTTLPIVVLNKK
jgi:DNA polymerase III epsilon subunit-like protein